MALSLTLTPEEPVRQERIHKPNQSLTLSPILTDLVREEREASLCELTLGPIRSMVACMRRPDMRQIR